MPNAIRNYMTFYLEGMLMGIAEEKVREVVPLGTVQAVPLSGPGLRGLARLRGEIVSVIGMRARLGLSARSNAANERGLLVEWRNEPMILAVDSFDGVRSVPASQGEAPSGLLPDEMIVHIDAAYKLQEGALFILNLDSLLDFDGLVPVDTVAAMTAPGTPGAHTAE